MSRPSSVRCLPRAFREEIGRLREDGQTLDAILMHLREMGVTEISRSALGRHVKSEKDIAGRIERSRALAETLVQRYGDDSDHRVLRLNAELLEDMILRLQTGEALDVEGVSRLASALRSVASARKAEVETREKMARHAVKDESGGSGATGLSEDSRRRIEEEILGVKR